MSKKKKQKEQASRDFASTEGRGRRRAPRKRVKRQLDRGQKVLALVLISAGLIYAVCFYFILMPLNEERNDLEAKESELKQRIDNVPKKEELSDDLQRVSELVPLEKDPEDLLENIQKVIDRHDVEVKALQAEAESTEVINDRVATTRYKITVEASDYFEMNDVIEALEKSDRLISVDDLNMTHKEDQVNATFSITVYHQAS